MYLRKFPWHFCVNLYIVVMASAPITVPYSGAGNPVYDGMSSLAKGVFEATKSVSCPLYRDFPGFMTGEMFGSPFAAQTDSLLNDLCNPTGNVPPPPSVPFTGGQCECVNYIVTWTLDGYGIGQSGGSVVRPGPIGRVYARSTGSSGQKQTGFNFGTPDCGAGFFSIISSALDGTTTITSVVRQDGQPDTCGTLPPSYPITQPPEGDLNVNVPIQVSPNFSINVPVSVFAPFTQIVPTLRIGDFNIDFDLGGLTISPDIDLNFPGTNPTNQPVPQPPPGQKPSDRVEKCDLTEVLKYLKRLRECQECDRDYDFLQTGFVSGRSGSITVPAGGIPLTVGLELIKKPSNSKEQPGLTEPNVVYGGWGWFSGNGFMTERMPIDSDLKLFDAPEKPSPQSFSFTCQVGYEARATMTYKRLKNPLPPL